MTASIVAVALGISHEAASLFVWAMQNRGKIAPVLEEIATALATLESLHKASHPAPAATPAAAPATAPAKLDPLSAATADVIEAAAQK
jgi:hypothetical protein